MTINEQIAELRAARAARIKARNLTAVEMRRAGYTLAEIGDHCGVSRQRIHQILQVWL